MIEQLFQAGPLYRIERRVHIIRDDNDDLIRHTASLLAIGWLPLIALSFLERAVTGAPVTFLQHADPHVRWLIGVPALFIGERWIDGRIQDALAYLLEVAIIPAHERFRLDHAEKAVASWSES